MQQIQHAINYFVHSGLLANENDVSEIGGLAMTRRHLHLHIAKPATMCVLAGATRLRDPDI